VPLLNPSSEDAFHLWERRRQLSSAIRVSKLWRGNDPKLKFSSCDPSGSLQALHLQSTPPPSEGV
jgi:hypothetical protein